MLVELVYYQTADSREDKELGEGYLLLGVALLDEGSPDGAGSNGIHTDSPLY